ncbi:hypothetical protein PBTT_00409 [Plasmodiophora brassicae]
MAGDTDPPRAEKDQSLLVMQAAMDRVSSLQAKVADMFTAIASFDLSHDGATSDALAPSQRSATQRPIRTPMSSVARTSREPVSSATPSDTIARLRAELANSLVVVSAGDVDESLVTAGPGQVTEPLEFGERGTSASQLQLRMHRAQLTRQYRNRWATADDNFRCLIVGPKDILLEELIQSWERAYQPVVHCPTGPSAIHECRKRCDIVSSIDDEGDPLADRRLFDLILLPVALEDMSALDFIQTLRYDLQYRGVMIAYIPIDMTAPITTKPFEVCGARVIARSSLIGVDTFDDFMDGKRDVRDHRWFRSGTPTLDFRPTVLLSRLAKRFLSGRQRQQSSPLAVVLLSDPVAQLFTDLFWFTFTRHFRTSAISTQSELFRRIAMSWRSIVARLDSLLGRPVPETKAALAARQRDSVLLQLPMALSELLFVAMDSVFYAGCPTIINGSLRDDILRDVLFMLNGTVQSALVMEATRATLFQGPFLDDVHHAQLAEAFKASMGRGPTPAEMATLWETFHAGRQRLKEEYESQSPTLAYRAPRPLCEDWDGDDASVSRGDRWRVFPERVLFNNARISPVVQIGLRRSNSMPFGVLAHRRSWSTPKCHTGGTKSAPRPTSPRQPGLAHRVRTLRRQLSQVIDPKRNASRNAIINDNGRREYLATLKNKRVMRQMVRNIIHTHQ